MRKAVLTRSLVKLPARHNRRGATMVEFALVAPLFFMFLFASAEFASVGTIRSSVQNAAYEGARLLIKPGGDPQEAKDEATRILSAIGVRKLTVEVTPDTINDTTETVTVEVKVPYADNTVLTPWFFGNRTLTSSCSMRTERYANASDP